ncbi:Nup85 nucleoporin-domain-containing protein [Cokeromyces recurvatus]|uniref:Nup85 nucleoporin-domain-containing protein n=1 Tax=Cokeromyces recurvatus TaxID=90255 RepID=UPI002220FE3C|nr:Nup85 nucleoporin-domain-containing protein [Cokeromyces recurvatus]KAI7908303.1 Nup85 nucleoporin-domain-containing protein [Cokeromyces recurvatus]
MNIIKVYVLNILIILFICFYIFLQDGNSSIDSVKKEHDLLNESLKNIQANAISSEKDFYKSSFDIFLEIHNYLYFHPHKAFDNIENSDLVDIVAKYIDLTHDYANAQEIQSIWDLCGKLYFSVDSTDLTTDLSEWVNLYYPLPNLEERRNQEEDEDLEEHNAIGPTWVWEHARRHLLRGNFEDSIMTLDFLKRFVTGHEKEAANELIELIQELLEMRTCIDEQKLYTEKWTAWSEKCKDKFVQYKFTVSSLEDAQDEKDDEIVLLYAILAGDECLLSICGTFFEQLVGTLLFVRPFRNVLDLNQLAQELEDDIDADSLLSTCTALVRGCFDDAFEYQQNNFWLQTHLGHALIAFNVYKKNMKGLTVSKNGEIVLDPVYYGIQHYASIIAEKYDMWNEAVTYLTCCLENKEIWIKQLLGNPPLPSKDINQLLSILNIANEYKMPGVRRFIQRALGERYEQEQNIRQAAIEYGKAEDIQSLDRLATTLFNSYLNNGKLTNIVTDMEELKQCPRYAALIRYHQFRSYLQQEEWEEASHILKELLKNKYLPTEFGSVLMIDNLDILQDSKHYYDTSLLLNMIELFKQIIQDPSNQAFIANYYKSIKNADLSPTIIAAKIRERLAYKAATTI